MAKSAYKNKKIENTDQKGDERKQPLQTDAILCLQEENSTGNKSDTKKPEINFKFKITWNGSQIKHKS